MDDSANLAGASDGLRGVFPDERPALLRFLVARSGSREDAEELLHDLWERAGQASGPIANPRAYLFTTANNLVLDRRRAERRRAAREEAVSRDPALGHGSQAVAADGAVDVLDALLEQENVERLRQAIAALPDGARRVLILHKIEERSQAEVAHQLGISRSGVEKHMAVAMRHLRTAILDCGDDDAAASSKRSTGHEE